MLRWIMVATAVVTFQPSANADAPAVSSTEQAASTTPAHADGRRDRKAWEDWFNGLAIGSYRDGAFWWFNERSTDSPKGCVSTSGDAEWVAGCRAAQQRLALPDVRWKTESSYALGWLSAVSADIPPEPITMSKTERAAASTPGYADGRRDRQAWENWLRKLPRRSSYQAGAFWWLDEHEKKNPLPCSSPYSDTQWGAGCRAAQQHLAVPDVRRTTEADYRLGWNSENSTEPP